MKNIVATYIYDDNGKVEFMLGACYSSEKDARIAAQMKGGVVMSAEEYDAECAKYGLS